MSKKTLTISIITIIILALIGGVLWYLNKYQVLSIKEPTSAPTEAGITVDKQGEKNEAVGQNGEDIAEIDTSDWKTYRNEEYGFEFKYPEGWEIHTYSEVVIRIIPDSIDDPYYAPVTISIRENKDLLQIRDWFTKNYPKNQNDIVNFSNIDINGFQGVKWYRKEVSRPTYTYYISRDDIIYQFSLIDSQIDFKKMNNMMKTIVFTFNFIN